MVKIRAGKKIKRRSRKAVQISTETLVKSRPLTKGKLLPLVFEPTSSEVDLVAWGADNRGMLTDLLYRHGGLLFRGFQMDLDAFASFCRAISPDLLDYIERAAPRKEVGRQIFNSTEYPQDQWIPLHHEMSYSHHWPSKLFFFCERPPNEGGCTPIADDREIVDLIPAEIKAAFEEKGVMYVRNYGEGADMPWREVFQTDDKEEVEAFLQRTKSQFQWMDGERLRTRQRRQVYAVHPVTGHRVWFNHAHMFHISNMPDVVRQSLLSEFTPQSLPRNSFFGDGTTIPDEVAACIRDTYRENAVFFPWEQGDVLILDNFLTSHGRMPFSGDRAIRVAMAELFENSC